MSVLKGKNPPIREKRLKTINAYYGDGAALFQDLQQDNVKQRVRTFSQTVFDDITNVLRLVSGINNAVAIIHGPRGCAASYQYFAAAGEVQNHWAVTNLNERDTIMGGETNLREAILKLNDRYRPQLIFVIATPVVAINNDDILSIIEELRGELETIIVPIFSDGFKSKIGITGYDTALHALVKYLPFDRVPVTGDFVNLLSITESEEDVKELERLVDLLGLKVNILPRFGNLENFVKAPQAKATIGINSDYSDYLGKAIEEKYGVPFLQAGSPIGTKGTYQWLVALAKATGLEAKLAEVSSDEISRLATCLQKPELKNKKIYISLPTVTAVAVAELVEELGAEVIGLTVEHIDLLHVRALQELLAKKPELQLHVAQGQPFEEVNILQKLKPDVYIGGIGQTAWAAKLGIPSFSPESAGILGYRGILRFVRGIAKALQNKAFVNRLSRNAELSYQSSWYPKSVHWYIKQEVK